jgi:predicted nucleotidyltransferase
MNSRMTIPKDKIQVFCRQHYIHDLGLFGSVLRDDFRPDGDIDILVGFEQKHKPGLIELGTMEEELVHIFGQNVDLVERQAIEKSQNYIRRRHILKSVEPIYAA